MCYNIVKFKHEVEILVAETEPTVNVIPEPSMILAPDVFPNESGSIPGVGTPPSLVENVYPIPGSAGPEPHDLKSHEIMGHYLYERLEPDTTTSRIRVVWGQIGRTPPRIVRVPAGRRVVSRLGRGEGWCVSPKVSAIIALGTLAASVAAPAAQDVADEIKGAAYNIGQFLNPPQPTTETIATDEEKPGPVVEVSVAIGADNIAGSTSVDPNAVNQFVGEVGELVADGGDIIEATAQGRSSDEYPRGRDNSIGVPDSPDVDLSDDRARAYAQAVDAALDTASIEAPYTTAEWVEYVLTADQKQQIGEAASAQGFADIYAAVAAVERGASVSPELAQMVNDWFTSQRGVEIHASVQMPGEPIIVTTYTDVEVPPVIPPAPEDPDRDYNPWLIPIPPIPRLRWRDKLINTFKWGIRPGSPILKPEIVREDDEHAWVRVRPEALKEDGTLIDDAVFMTRKMEFYLREGDKRFPATLRADFESDTGEPRSVYVNFMDHVPADETVELFGDLLRKTITMKGGNIEDQIRHIFVFRSSDAGTEHGDPRRIALGIDKQDPSGILGHYIPLLRAAEIHMDDTYDSAQLEAMFNDFYGPYWTIAHEVSGHAKDAEPSRLKLRPVRARGIANAHILQGNPWRDRIGRWHDILGSIDPRRSQPPVMFDVEYVTIDRNGNPTTIHTGPGGITQYDPRLSHARRAHVRGRRPTVYSDHSRQEHWGELAAGAVTGIEIPFSQAGVEVTQHTTDGGEPAAYARGYHPDRQELRAYNLSVGAVPGTFPSEFDPAKMERVKLRLLSPEEDSVLAGHMARARTSVVPEPEEMIAVLATVTNRGRFGRKKRK